MNDNASTKEIKKYLKNKINRKKFIQNDKEWLEAIKTKWWYSKNTIDEIQAIIGAKDEFIRKSIQLRDLLISFCDGSEACVDLYDEDLDAILSRGRLWYRNSSSLIKGEPGQCHRNSCELWELNHKDHDVSIVTGYALSNDGMWRQHSWLVRRIDNTEHIIETTEKRIAYFGFVMTDQEAYQFVEEND